jgi:hypothetical protein
MTWGAAAIGGATLVGGLLASNASKNAADTQSQSTQYAADLQNKQYEQTRADLAPYRQAGTASLAKLSYLLGLNSGPGSQPVGAASAQTTMSAPVTRQPTAAEVFARQQQGMPWEQAVGPITVSGPVQTTIPGSPGTTAPAPNDPAYGSLLKDFTGADLTSEPGYQFQLAEGTKALQRSAAARGGLYSGATLKGLQRYGTDYAGTKYNEAFNRDLTSKQAKYNFLAGVSGTGQTATSQTAQLGALNAANTGNLITSGGAARAAGIVGSSNAINQTIGNAANIYQNYAMLNRLYPGGNV